jgi:AcrR family transcriptional regulator
MSRAGTEKKSGDLRHTAEERRGEVLTAAVAEFALHGLHGTSTEMIARRTGISQPYIFRLFPSKKDLFLAAVDQCFDRVEATFKRAVQKPSEAELRSRHHLQGDSIEERLHAMGHAYVQLITKRELLLFQMQAYAACSEDDVRTKVRQRWEQLTRLAAELSGAPPQEVTLFFARGMLLNVVASMGLVPAKAADDWGHQVLGYA